MKRLAAIAAAASFLAVGAFSVSGHVTEAHAAACSGPSCVGKDPHQLGCDVGASTVSSAYGVVNGVRTIYVEERWSAACVANWTRITNLTSSGAYMEANLIDQNNSTGQPWSGWVPAGYISWTNMGNGNHVQQACGDFEFGNGTCANPV